MFTVVGVIAALLNFIGCVDDRAAFLAFSGLRMLRAMAFTLKWLFSCLMRAAWYSKMLETAVRSSRGSHRRCTMLPAARHDLERLLSQICAIGCAVHVQLFQHSVGAGIAPAWSCCRCASARRAALPVPGGPAATQFPRAFLDRRAHSLCGDIRELRSVFHSSFVHIDRMFDTRFQLLKQHSVASAGDDGWFREIIVYYVLRSALSGGVSSLCLLRHAAAHSCEWVRACGVDLYEGLRCVMRETCSRARSILDRLGPRYISRF